VAKIEKALMALDGVEQATVHFNTGRIEVEHNPAAVKSDALIAAVRAVGYEAKVAPF
jgi:copper chaperone CopZ